MRFFLDAYLFFRAECTTVPSEVCNFGCCCRRNRCFFRREPFDRDRRKICGWNQELKRNTRRRHVVKGVAFTRRSHLINTIKSLSLF